MLLVASVSTPRLHPRSTRRKLSTSKTLFLGWLQWTVIFSLRIIMFGCRCANNGLLRLVSARTASWRRVRWIARDSIPFHRQSTIVMAGFLQRQSTVAVATGFHPIRLPPQTPTARATTKITRRRTSSLSSSHTTTFSRRQNSLGMAPTSTATALYFSSFCATLCGSGETRANLRDSFTRSAFAFRSSSSWSPCRVFSSTTTSIPSSSSDSSRSDSSSSNEENHNDNDTKNPSSNNNNNDTGSSSSATMTKTEGEFFSDSVTDFASLGIQSPILLRRLKMMGLQRPTVAQAESFREIAAGNTNLTLGAETGRGETSSGLLLFVVVGG